MENGEFKWILSLSDKQVDCCVKGDDLPFNTPASTKSAGFASQLSIVHSQFSILIPSRTPPTAAFAHWRFCAIWAFRRRWNRDRAARGKSRTGREYPGENRNHFAENRDGDPERRLCHCWLLGAGDHDSRICDCTSDESFYGKADEAHQPLLNREENTSNRYDTDRSHQKKDWGILPAG